MVNEYRDRKLQILLVFNFMHREFKNIGFPSVWPSGLSDKHQVRAGWLGAGSISTFSLSLRTLLFSSLSLLFLTRHYSSLLTVFNRPIAYYTLEPI